MSNSKVVLILVVALGLGFLGGFLGGEFTGGDSEVSDLSDRVDAINDRLNTLDSRMNELPSDFASYATVDEVSALRDSIENLEGQVSSGNGSEVTSGELTDLENSLGNLETRVDQIESTGSSSGDSGLKVGYVNATEAFTVFTDAVSEERERAQAKEEELVSLREQAVQGEISESEYQRRGDILQAEQLKAQLDIDMAMVEKMISAPGFQSVSGQLEELSGQVQPAMEELNTVLSNMKEGAAAPEEVSNTLSQINNIYQQLDNQLNSLIESKIFQVANRRGNEEGYDLVLRQENVVLYGNRDSVNNMTETAKSALREELNA